LVPHQPAFFSSFSALSIQSLRFKSPASGGGVTSRPALFAAYSASFAAWLNHNTKNQAVQNFF
jgi:hypothetical protein